MPIATMLRLVAGSRCRRALAPLAVGALFASMMPLAGPAAALPPDGGSGSNPVAGALKLRATSYLGFTEVYPGVSGTRAMQNAPIYLSGRTTDGQAPRLRITETSLCNYGSRSVGGVAFEWAGPYTVSDPASRCSDGLYQAIVTAEAFENSGLTTGKLTIHVYGPQYSDDRLPIFSRW
jgi:hypothetical protein